MIAFLPLCLWLFHSSELLLALHYSFNWWHFHTMTLRTASGKTSPVWVSVLKHTSNSRPDVSSLEPNFTYQNRTYHFPCSNHTPCCWTSASMTPAGLQSVVGFSITFDFSTLLLTLVVKSTNYISFLFLLNTGPALYGNFTALLCKHSQACAVPPTPS